ncbi:MAG TPA: helix-turn-helix domain-containing protein [Phenylobacterium sp.]
MIYYIQDSTTMHIKIGYAADPWRRRDNLQTGAPGTLTIIGLEEGNEAREAEIHKQFAAGRMRGEWFAPSTVLLGHIAALPEVPRPMGERGYRLTWGASGMTDGDLAPLVGVTRAQLNRIRNGVCAPSLVTALKIHRHTGIPLEDLAREAS